jgi:hypothetical protein
MSSIFYESETWFDASSALGPERGFASYIVSKNSPNCSILFDLVDLGSAYIFLPICNSRSPDKIKRSLLLIFLFEGIWYDAIF